MSELPERKVLKEMIQKLKTKLIQSMTTYSIQQKLVSNSILKSLQILDNNLNEFSGPTKTMALIFHSVISSLGNSITLLTSNVNTVFADMNLYNETLERYSTELDNTLESIFEQAKKRAEEKLKKQEELRKRKPSDMTV